MLVVVGEKVSERVYVVIEVSTEICISMYQ